MNMSNIPRDDSLKQAARDNLHAPAGDGSDESHDAASALLGNLSFPGVEQPSETTADSGIQVEEADLDFGKVGEGTSGESTLTGMPPLSAASAPEEESLAAAAAPKDVVDADWDIAKIDIPAVAQSPASVAATDAQLESVQGSEAVDSLRERFRRAGTGADGDSDADDVDDIDTGGVQALHLASSAQHAHGVVGGPGHAKRKIVIALVAIVAVIAAIVTIVTVQRNMTTQQAHETLLAQCTKSVTSDKAAKKALASELTASQDAQEITASDVADASTIEELKTAVDTAKSAGASANLCSTSMTDAALTSAMNANKALAKDTATKTSNLTGAVAAVESSKEAKAISKAKSALQKQVDTANERYTSSAGVASEKTRTALKTAISEAKKLIKSSAASSSDISSTSKKLKSALAAVNSSINSAAGTTTDGTQSTDGSTNQPYAPSTVYGGAGAGTGTGNGTGSKPKTTPSTSGKKTTTPRKSTGDEETTDSDSSATENSDSTGAQENDDATGGSATGEGGEE